MPPLQTKQYLLDNFRPNRTLRVTNLTNIHFYGESNWEKGVHLKVGEEVITNYRCSCGCNGFNIISKFYPRGIVVPHTIFLEEQTGIGNKIIERPLRHE